MEGRVCEEQEESAGLMQGKIHEEGDSELLRRKELASQERKFISDFGDSLLRWLQKKREAESMRGIISKGRLHDFELAFSQGGSLVSQQEMPGEFYPLSHDECQKRKMGLDVSQGEISGYSYPPILEECRKILGSYSFDFAAPHHLPDGSLMSNREMDRVMHRANKHIYAQKALEFFEKSQGVEFEIVEALYAECAKLVFPGANFGQTRLAPYNSVQEWCHVSFIARPKRNSHSTNVSPKYFFGELLKREFSGGYDVKYCGTFKPSDYPGFRHGCVLCPADQKYHPGRRGYFAGKQPCHVWEQEDRWT